MENQARNEPNSQVGLGILIAAVILVLGVLAKAALVESAGWVVTGLAVQLFASLVAAVVMEYYARTKGAVVIATLILIGSVLLPLLWVSDPVQWLRANPVNAGVILIAAVYASWRYQARWPIYAVALILAAVQIGVSFL
jgi:hypothetical protein